MHRTFRRELVPTTLASRTASQALTLDDLQSFFCDFLGFGQAEVAAFHQRFGEGGRTESDASLVTHRACSCKGLTARLKDDVAGDAMSLEGFKKGYASLGLRASCISFKVAELEELHGWTIPSTCSHGVNIRNLYLIPGQQPPGKKGKSCQCADRPCKA